MNDKSYKSMLKNIKEHKTLFNILKVMYKWLPAFMFMCYPLMLIVKAIQGFDKIFWLLLCIPAGVLVLVTVLRKLINRQRPYEKFQTPPLLKRDGKGESFPSRHTASAFIIAMSAFTLNLWLGVFLFAIATLIALTRVLSGVHYVSDVLAGGALSIIIGILFFVI